MVSKVIKRDGKIVDFDKLKILNAVTKANDSVDKEMTEEDIATITDEVVELIDESNNTVEQIQDLVEENLIKYGFSKTAKAYIIYRENHNKIRNNESFLMDIYKKITYAASEEEDLKRENANIDCNSSMGSMLKYGSEGSKYFVCNYVLPKDIALAHADGECHVHDLDFYMLTETCCQIDLNKLFKHGFNTGHGSIRPPQSIECYSALTCIAIQSNQNEMHGGQSIPALDFMLAPGVTKTYKKEFIDACTSYITITHSNFNGESYTQDVVIKMLDNFDFKLPPENYALDEETNRILGIIKKPFGITVSELKEMFHYAIPKAISRTEKRTFQAMESLVHNLCTMNSRAGSQVPFSSVNYGTDTSPEGRMIIRNLLKATDNGLGLGETPIFPVQIFKLKENVSYNPGDPNYDLFRYAMKVSAKRLFPNFSSLMSSFNKPYIEKSDDPNHEVAYMGAVARGYVKLYIPSSHIKYSTVDIACLYDFLKERGLCGKITQFDEYTWYTEVKEGVFISDSRNDGPRYVPLKKWMRFQSPDIKWYRLNSDTCSWGGCDFGYNNLFTEDHPLLVFNNASRKKERKTIKEIFDTSPTRYDLFAINDLDENDCAKITDLKPVDECVPGYDVETASDRFDIYVDSPSEEQAIIGISSHNCRTRVIGNVYDPSREVTNSRGNLSFTTINLPMIGIKADKDIDKFFSLLDEKIDLCFRQLLHRLGIQKKRKAKNYPFLMLNGVWLDSEKLDPEDEIGDILNHGTLSIGFIGLAETLVALIGKHHGESEEAQELGLKIVKHMRERCDEKSEETKLNFTLIATPAESLCSKIAKVNQEKFGTIPGVTDKAYVTNSSHVPVYYKISAHKKIEIESAYHKYCNAGHIVYVEVSGNIANNIDAFETIVRHAVESDAGYIAVNHQVDRDPVCGYVGIIGDVCPRCGRKSGEGIPISKLKELRKIYKNVPYAKEEL